MSNNMIPRAKVPLPKAEVHAKHPFRNKGTHQTLLDYIKPRLMLGKTDRDNRLDRMVRIDKNVAGWMRMSDDDRQRQSKQDSTGIPQALTVNLPLNFVQMDDMMTYYAQTFAPNRGMFYQQGKPDETQPASQIVTLMNNHAIYSGYYPHVLRALFSTLKYNLGGFHGYWAKDTGPKLAKGPQDQTVVQTTTIWQGNRLRALDMYNTFWDPSVTPPELHRLGEWCASAELVSHYTLQKRAADGLYFNCEEALEGDAGVGNAVYYRSPPAEAQLQQDDSTGGRTNWMSILSASNGFATDNGFELVEMYVKLNPWQLDLVPNTKANSGRNTFEIWRITLLNDSTIIEATPMNNIHGFLPYFMGMLNDDSMGTAQKSVAEIIQPLQDFASFLLNTHVRATRKNIWGLTVYDSTVVDLGSIPADEVSARVAAKPTGAGKNIRDSIYEHNSQLDTKQTMGDLGSVMEIINQFFPTTSLPSQIASIDRAVDSQVAAVQQGANRRMQKGARLLDDSMFRPLRFCFYYNIIQFQEDGVAISDFYGRPISVDLQQLRETDLPYIIGQGLKALDRQAAAAAIQNIIFALIQNPATAQRIDLMALIDYWTSMIDVDIDMKQFELAPPQPQAVPGAEGTPQVDPATGQPIQPMTDPAAVTQPLRG